MRHASISQTQSIVFNPEIHVEISHNGNMNDSDATKFGRSVATTALDILKDTFSRRGIVADGIGL